MQQLIQFLKEWQTLIGVFCAAMLSIFIFIFKDIFNNIKKYKERLRQIEISTVQSLNDVYELRNQLEYFMERIKDLEEDIDSTPSKQFFLSEINFPIVREIYWNKNLSIFKVKSYYLHNKILWIGVGIKDINKIMKNLGNDFNEMKARSRELALLGKATPANQKETYKKGLISFREAINKFNLETLPFFIESLAQINFYNMKMRKKNGNWFIWRMEKRDFKYFRRKKDFDSFHVENLESIERIDESIKNEVIDIIQRADDNASKKLVN
ncbi:MAG TPA: hypothetical protein PKU93_00555 [Candidatus Pacearchaeota archaeon]|mgnify:CR=1 FL=1|nr:hypothetical protein [Candidatus Pacearchaeota archaeon]